MTNTDIATVLSLVSAALSVSGIVMSLIGASRERKRMQEDSQEEQ